ncbi:hypothetical protein [Streptomyces sp. NPDC056244]|uniref:hypothetical protein n=1 Tax=Streptomyces sp. NPDC056244 TaxID=3345762 RepID=UPI0035E09507
MDSGDARADATAAATALLPTLRADVDAPVLPPGVTGPAWIQRSVRIAHIHTTTGTVAHHYRHSDELDGHPAQPLGYALAAVMSVLRDFDRTADELESLWDRRTTGVAAWERAHLPTAVREHIIALEELARALCTLCFDMTLDPHEPH